MASAVTPGAVAPPLSPLNGAKHGWAKKSGTASLPVDVSQREPQSMVSASPWSVASANDIGNVTAAGGALAGGVVVCELAAVVSVDAAVVWLATVGVAAAVEDVVAELASSSESRVTNTMTPIAATATTAPIGPHRRS